MRNVSDNSDQIGKELFISNYLYQLPELSQMKLFEPKLEYFSKEIETLDNK